MASAAESEVGSLPSGGLAPIPVTLLTGFLGAGKTTLLNRLLAAPHGQRIAVIENEFGAESIDAELLSPGAATVVELSNGCICCSVRGELAAALGELLARRDSGALAFDRLVIETTGLADPGPIIQTFLQDERLRDRFLLDGVIALADACHILQQLAREPVASAQLAYADRILVSKAHEATATAPGSLVARLRAINSRAPIAESNSRNADSQELLQIGGFSLDEQGLPPRRRFVRSAQANVGIQPPRHDSAIVSVLLEAEHALDLDAVSEFVEALIAEHANDLLRYKGILSIAGEPRRLVFQGVHRIAGFDYGRDWQADELRDSRIVLIGRQLPAADLQARFASLKG